MVLCARSAPLADRPATLGSLPVGAFARDAARLEAPFAAADYDGRPRAAEFAWLPGTGRVLLSAPHTVNHWREGRIKSADRQTGAIARAVQRRTGSPLIARTRGPAGDPNWDRESAYKEAIAAAVGRGGLSCLVDLHGAARGHAFDVAIGTAGVGGDWRDEVASIFAAHGLAEVMVDGEYFTARHPGTVTWFAAHRLGLPAVQIEINGFYRNPRRRPIAYDQAVTALIAVVETLAARFP